MIGGEQHWIAADNSANGRMTFELPIKKSPHGSPIPTQGMDEIPVQGQVALGELGAWQQVGLRTGDGHVEDSQVEEGDRLVMAEREIEGLPGFGQ